MRRNDVKPSVGQINYM